jgi:hypothetical protein
VITDVHALYYGIEVNDQSLVPGDAPIWHGQASWNGVAILAKGMDPLESRRGLPGDEGDTHSRYLEGAAHDLIVGCLYLPNGNPQPGPKSGAFSSCKQTTSGPSRSNHSSRAGNRERIPLILKVAILRISTARDPV